MIQHMTVIVHFISNLTPPLIGQEVLVHGSDVRDPCSISNLTPPLIGEEVLVHGSDVGDPCSRDIFITI